MKSIFLLLLIALAFSGKPCFAQSSADTTHTTFVQPDKETQYLDDQGQKMEESAFMKKLTTGGYKMEPIIENGKIKSLRLKPSGIDLSVGVLAPDFTVKDLQGNSYHLRDLKGKIVVLNFWFTHCVGCVAEMPQLNELADRYKTDPNVIFLAITFDELPKVQQFLKTHSFSYHITPGAADVVKAYGLQSFPFSIVIDRQGHIAFSDNSTLPSNMGTTMSGIIGQLK